MDDFNLSQISAIDGRYHRQTQPLKPFFSEGALIAKRMQVQAQWLQHLSGGTASGQNVLQLPYSEVLHPHLQAFRLQVPNSLIAAAKQTDRTVNHDVKACEYTLGDHLTAQGIPEDVRGYIHFGCTSEDINNLAYALLLKDYRQKIFLPQSQEILNALKSMAQRYAELPMLGRTHGQPASPTTLGKELAVFGFRLQRSQQQLVACLLEGKINGAVGAFNAHRVAFPYIDWPRLARSFVEDELGLNYVSLTTQIESHDFLARFLHELCLYNSIALGLCRDIWGYIALGYFRLAANSVEVGSSTMPHKVNPIDFENAEGNYGLSSALAYHLAQKLPVSRWQRDLSDSTVLRSLGTVFGYHTIAQNSLKRGLGKIAADAENIAADLERHPEVLAEAVQIVLKTVGQSQAYEELKKLTRGRKISQADLHHFIHTANLSEEYKAMLLNLRPQTYIGFAKELVKEW